MLKNIIKKHFSESDIDDMVRFANLITPPTWNVFAHPEGRIIRPTFLNIELSVLTIDEMDEDEGKKNASGFVRSPMRYEKLSALASARGWTPDDYKDWCDILKRFGDGTVASVHLDLCPYRGDWKGTMVHELAHIAETRRKAQKEKPFRHAIHGVAVGRTVESESQHDPIFLRAFATMIKRTEVIFKSIRHPTIFRMWNSFASYAFELKKAGVPHEKLPLRLLPDWAAMHLTLAEDAGFREFLLSFFP
jgi:hypothetical protein